MTGVQHLYAALSWSAVAFGGVWLICLIVRPKAPSLGAWWSFVFKMALLGGGAVGLLALALGASFPWRW